MELNNNIKSPFNGVETENEARFPLTKANFILMAIAGAIIIIGFLLMLGGSTTETEFNPDIFSTRRIVVGPTVAFLGFIFMVYGIMYKHNKKSENK